MKPGLVSVTFRKLTPGQIIALCAEARLEGIEWGGDVHVPHGEIQTATEIGMKTREAGLRVAAYGSYYRLASGVDPDFESVLETASALGAPVIRVWAGRVPSAEATEAHWEAVVADALRCADLCKRAGITLAYEFHSGTLTDSAESTVALLGRTPHPNIKTLWQPPHGKTLEACLEGLRLLIPRLGHIHAFHWWPDGSQRHRFSSGLSRWIRYTETLAEAGADCDILLEFVQDDSVEAFLEDSMVLRQLVC
jgi:sugar phosphate isomerase/epimerase